MLFSHHRKRSCILYEPRCREFWSRATLGYSNRASGNKNLAAHRCFPHFLYIRTIGQSRPVRTQETTYWGAGLAAVRTGRQRRRDRESCYCRSKRSTRGI